MSSSLQTFLALGLALLAAGYLAWTWLRPKKTPGCGSACACGAGCHSLGGAVSPAGKKLRARLKH